MRIDPHIPTKSPVGATLFVSVVLGMATLALGALSGRPWLYLVGLAVTGVSSDLAEPVTAVRQILNGAQLSITSRTWFVELLAIAMAATTVPAHPLRWAGAVAALSMTRTAVFLAQVPVSRRLGIVGETRNLDLGPRIPSVWFPNARQAFIGSAMGCALIALSVLLDSVFMLGLAIALSAGFAVVILGRAVLAVSEARRLHSHQGLDRIQAAVQGYAPSVVMYFAGPRESTYQLNMWLPTLEQLGERVLVLIRERHHWEDLAPTSLPVIGLSRATDVMDLDIPTARVALYAAHVGNNIHFLRKPRLKHVFIGHGESDKVASVNPASKAFDQIWVAGRASRDRWAAARVGVRDDIIKEVGRPQLGGIQGPRSQVDSLRTVLYAPTWEGWSSDLAVSSVPSVGLALVSWLMDQPDIRVIYKPHPLTGTVQPAVQRAHARIVEAIAAHPRGQAQAPTSPEELAQAPDRHVVITSGLSIFDCFNASDALIGDISSVVPDYLASGKPYAVPNPANREHDQIRAELPSTRAAYVLDRSQGGWDAFLGAVRGDDPQAGGRLELRTYILGPHYADPVTPWRTALTELIREAEHDWPELATTSHTAPGDPNER